MDGEIFERLRAASTAVFEGTEVTFAYLFGSAARGDTHLRSDVDVAVFLEPAPTPERALDLSLELARRLTTATDLGGIEVVVLNGAPLPLRGRAVRERRVIFSRDEPARVAYESLTLRAFFDHEIHARPLDERFLRDAAEGRR